MIKFAVISFPGTNCEEENVRVFKRNGMDAETILWNDPGILDGSRLDEFDGYCLAGGFSYEDRSRSGIIAAQNPIMDIIKEEASKGKIVIGICNGAQMVIERGLIPGFDNYDLSAGLAWNEMVKGGEVVDTGFRNSWSYLKNIAPKNRSAFNNFEGLLHIPYAHGEGRFIFKDPNVLKLLKENSQILFQYSDEQGKISTELGHSMVVRTMPNTPARIGEGITVWVASDAVSTSQKEQARQILSALGEEVFVEDESYLDMATALSGTGPAYVYMFMEAMIDAGVHMGFPRRISEKLVVQTMRGSVNFYEKNDVHVAALRNQVTSSGGTSAEALYYLEKAGVRTAISRAIWAAYQRSLELGQEKKEHVPKDQ